MMDVKRYALPYRLSRSFADVAPEPFLKALNIPASRPYCFVTESGSGVPWFDSCTCEILSACCTLVRTSESGWQCLTCYVQITVKSHALLIYNTLPSFGMLTHTLSA